MLLLNDFSIDIYNLKNEWVTQKLTPYFFAFFFLLFFFFSNVKKKEKKPPYFHMVGMHLSFVLTFFSLGLVFHENNLRNKCYMVSMQFSFSFFKKLNYLTQIRTEKNQIWDNDSLQDPKPILTDKIKWISIPLSLLL